MPRCSEGCARRRRTARGQAVAAGVAESILARGDSSLARAELLARRRRTAEAAVELSAASTLWSDAATRARVSAPPVPPPETAQHAAPPPPPPAPTPVPAPQPAPAEQIHRLFEEYGAAIESRSVDAIRRVYPGLSPAQSHGVGGLLPRRGRRRCRPEGDDTERERGLGGGAAGGGVRVRGSGDAADEAGERRVPGAAQARGRALADRLAAIAVIPSAARDLAGAGKIPRCARDDSSARDDSLEGVFDAEGPEDVGPHAAAVERERAVGHHGHGCAEW